MSVDITEEQYRQKYLKYKAKYEALKKVASEHQGGASVFSLMRGVYHMITSKKVAEQFKVGDSFSDADELADKLHKLAYIFKDGDTKTELILRSLGMKRLESAANKAQRLVEGNMRDEIMEDVNLPRSEALYAAINANKLGDELNRLNIDSQGNKLTSKLPNAGSDFQYDTLISLDIPAFVTRWSKIKVIDIKPLQLSTQQQSQQQNQQQQQRSKSPRGNKNQQQRSNSPRKNRQPQQSAEDIMGNQGIMSKYFSEISALQSITDS